MKRKRHSRRSAKRRRRQQKRRYHTRNWKAYNAALVQRGSLTLWLEDSVLEGWFNPQRTGKRGASRTYSDRAIEAALTLKVVYRLPLRATQGLLRSLLPLLGCALPVPDYSTLSRRQETVAVPHPQLAPGPSLHGQSLHLVVDSTGCKIYGEGEWKVRQHGVSKRRTWRKLHIAVDQATGSIVAAVVTTNDVADSAVLPDLLEQVAAPVEQLSGDGAYDQRPCYDTLAERQQAQGQSLRVTIPPRRGARIWQHGNRQGTPLARDANLRRIRQVGRRRWKEESGYHRRSLAETAMFRLKTIFGDKLRARGFEAQAREAFIRCAALNRMTRLGMPASYAE